MFLHNSLALFMFTTKPMIHEDLELVENARVLFALSQGGEDHGKALASLSDEDVALTWTKLAFPP